MNNRANNEEQCVAAVAAKAKHILLLVVVRVVAESVDDVAFDVDADFDICSCCCQELPQCI